MLSAAALTSSDSREATCEAGAHTILKGHVRESSDGGCFGSVAADAANVESGESYSQDQSGLWHRLRQGIAALSDS